MVLGEVRSTANIHMDIGWTNNAVQKNSRRFNSSLATQTPNHHRDSQSQQSQY